MRARPPTAVAAGWGMCGRREGRGVGEDLALELTKGRPGLEPEFVGEVAADLLIRL